MTPSNQEQVKADQIEGSSVGLVEQLRAGAGTKPLPPPPWYRRLPIGFRWIARGVTATVCLWAAALWYTNRGCDVVGRVTDMDGWPLAGVVVHTEDGSAATVSEDDGRFTLTCRRPGPAWVVVENPSSGTACPVELKRGEQVNLGRLYLYTP